MAASKSASGDVKHVVDANGDHHIGVEHDGVFVPYATVAATTIADRVEAGKSPEAKAAATSAPSDEGGE